MIIENDDAEGLVGWGFIKVLLGQFWDEGMRAKAQEIARGLFDEVSTDEEKAIVRSAGLSGYE